MGNDSRITRPEFLECLPKSTGATGYKRILLFTSVILSLKNPDKFMPEIISPIPAWYHHAGCKKLKCNFGPCKIPNQKQSSQRYRAWLPDGYSQIYRSYAYVLGPSGLWTTAPLRYAAKFDPFLSLDCAPMPGPSTMAQSKERKGSNFAIWQPWWRELELRR